MKIGGKMYLADQQRAAQNRGYRQQMNRQAVERNVASMQNLGQSIFATNASAGQEAVALFMQMAVDRINADVKSRFEQLNSRYEAIASSTTDILA